MLKIMHIGRNFSDISIGSKKLLELFPGLALELEECRAEANGVEIIASALKHLFYREQSA